jgi:cell division protein FtsN
MAARKRRQSARSSRQQAFPGWAWMLFGLAIGLSVAFAVYMKDRRPPPPGPAAQPASLETAIDEPVAAGRDTPAATRTREKRFTFYDMLPNFEVVIPEQEPNVKADTEIRPVAEPGIYVLQAGSFTEYADADRRRAELALQGIESRIQRVTIDDRTYHRVRIGPIEDLEELNLLRSRLRAADIDALRIRLGD